MGVKILLTWNIKPDTEQEYFQFVIGEFIPSVQRIGLQPVDAWATLYGNYPQIQVGMYAPTAQSAWKVLRSPAWKAIEERLLEYVTDYAYKVVPARRGFQF